MSGNETRLSYEESCERLKPDYISETPPLPESLPRYDDEDLGLSFFKTYVGDQEDWSNLTIPRTYFGRSELRGVNFHNTDLSESSMCWNDFVDVVFTETSLKGSDLRSSAFRRVSFASADLRNADLRHSTFEHCDFGGANLEGAILSLSQKRQVALSRDQTKAVSWRWRAGVLPDGG